MDYRICFEIEKMSYNKMDYMYYEFGAWGTVKALFQLTWDSIRNRAIVEHPHRVDQTLKPVFLKDF